MYLKYAIACFTHISGQLYNLKSNEILPRVEEIKQTQKNYKRAFIKILFQNSNVSVDVEKLNFLAKHDPNVILLLRDANGAYNYVVQAILELNKTIDNFMCEPSDLNKLMVLDLNKKISLCVDDAIYLAEKSSNTLIKGCSMYYNDENVKKIELTKEDYKKLKPEPIESFEKQEFFQNLNVVTKTLSKRLRTDARISKSTF